MKKVCSKVCSNSQEGYAKYQEWQLIRPCVCRDTDAWTFLFWLPAQSSEQPIEAGKQEQMEPEENEFLDCSFGVSSVWACFLFGYSYIMYCIEYYPCGGAV